MLVDFTVSRQGGSSLLTFIQRRAGIGLLSSAFILVRIRRRVVTYGRIEQTLQTFKLPLFDNAKTIILECRMMALAEKYDFTQRICRPHRAKTKSNVERFNPYLKHNFIPLALR